ncbi:MAG: RETICULATA-related protein [Bacteriovoracia bacterium]
MQSLRRAAAWGLLFSYSISSAHAAPADLLRLVTGPVGRYVFQETEAGAELARRLLGRQLTSQAEDLTYLAQKISAEEKLAPIASALERRLISMENELKLGRAAGVSREAGVTSLEDALAANPALRLEEKLFLQARALAPAVQEGLADLAHALPAEYQTLGTRTARTYRGVVQGVKTHWPRFADRAESLPVQLRNGLLISPKAAEANLLKKFTRAELDDAVTYLMGKYGISEGELLQRLGNHHINVEEVLTRFQQGGRLNPAGTVFERIYETLAWGLVDRQLNHPEYLKKLGLLVGAELLVTAVAEYYFRGDKLAEEFDLFIGDVIGFTLTELILGWTTAGRVTNELSRRGGVPMPATIWSRDFSAKAKSTMFLKKGITVGAGGFATCFAGFAASEALNYWDELDDPNSASVFERFKTVLWRATLSGISLSIWSNFRYQSMEAFDLAVIRRHVKNPHLRKAVYSKLYVANNVTGVISWIWYERFMTWAWDETVGGLLGEAEAMAKEPNTVEKANPDASVAPSP